MFFLFSGCSPQKESPMPSDMVATAIVESQPTPSLYSTHLTLESETLYVYLENIFGDGVEEVAEATLYSAGGVNACEILVIQVCSENMIDEMVENIETYISGRISDFYGYAPEQVALLENAIVATSGKTLLLAICEDGMLAESIFNECSNINSISKPIESVAPVAVNENGWKIYKSPGTADMTIYDTSKILEAYKSGDSSKLSENDLEILSRCCETIDEIIDPAMSEYEKELAIHDWIIKWADYDDGVFSDSKNPNGANPYGLLVDKAATCMGYTSTFQLFMDLLDIECRTVVGATYDSQQDHAWNIVCLEGEWYCVDVTWDDPIGTDATDDSRVVKIITHEYFNVTSDFLRKADHQWDYDNTPEAVGNKYVYGQN